MRRIDVLATAVLLLAAGTVLGAQTYCCHDGGRRICSDRLPQECYGKAYSVLNAQGVVVHEEPAPLTPEQRARKAAEDKRKREAERARKEEERRNRILLQTYSSVDDIEVLRARAVQEIEKGREEAEELLAELMKRRQELANEAEFYQKRPMPAALAESIRTNEADILAQQSVVASKKKDIDAVNARYDEDRRRYLEITRRWSREETLETR